MASCCETLEAFDLHRYYDYALATRNVPLRVIIDENWSRSVDFIYYAILHISLKIGIPLNLITALTVTIAYAMIIDCMKVIYKGRMEWYVLFGVLFLTPVSWVIEISRNMMAFMFIFISLKQYYQRHWFLTFLFVSLGILTHFSSLMYIAVVALCVFIQKIKINKILIICAVLFILVLSYLIPSYMLDIMSMILSGGDTVFSTQYGAMEADGVSNWSNFGTADIVAIVYGLIYSIIILLKNRIQGFEFWCLFLLTAMFSFFVNSSQMFTNRCMMFIPMFWALNIAQIYRYGTKRDISTIKTMSVCCVVLALWHVFSYRDMYFPYFF